VGDILLKEEDLKTYSKVRFLIKGISFGCMLAITISWHEYQSIFWAIVHGLLSWLYVGYYHLTHGPDSPMWLNILSRWFS